MQRALIPSEILGKLHRADRQALRGERSDRGLDRLDGRFGHLTGLPRIALLVRPLPEERRLAVNDVEPGAHSVLALGGSHDLDRIRDRHPPDPRERIANDLPLHLQLPLVSDGGVDAAAT